MADVSTVAGNPLSEYLPDADLAKLRKVTVRTQRKERQRGDGPPYVKDGERNLLPPCRLSRLAEGAHKTAGAFGTRRLRGRAHDR